jgi:hypothetical protein
MITANRLASCLPMTMTAAQAAKGEKEPEMTEREKEAYSAIQDAVEAAIEKAAVECGGDLVSLHSEITAALIDILAYHCIAMGGATTPEDVSINADLVKVHFIERIDRRHPRKAER